MESTSPNHVKPLCFLFFFFFFLHRTTASSTPLLPKEALPTKSGYLPVNLTTGSAIFYTFYEAQNPISPPLTNSTPHLAPRRLRLLLHDRQLLRAWSVAGTGFSIASTPQEIPRDQFGVAKHLFAAITNFVGLDLVFKSRPIYITGESYAGKYIPAIGYYILKRNAKLSKSRRVNLAGVAIGDGLTDPVIQVATHAVNAYFSGLINERQKRELEELQLEAVKLTEAGNGNRRVVQSLVEDLLRHEEVKKALGVSNVSIVFEECSDLVGEVLHEDVMKSVKYMVEFLVRQSKVLLYQGRFDLRDGVVSTEAWVKTMKWEGMEKFLLADRKVWKLSGETAGYVQKWGSLSQVMVSSNGHLLPADQPLRAQAMIEDWVLDEGLFANV
ncbi:hypothetical protein M0R45_022381 [Rubus argutus]|uniref:Carboxypeptidase n=1 Tax=Rubus argutus TaxID=59490 RepID=A0AAW1XG86_RUBAR